MPAGDIVRPYRVSCQFSAKFARTCIRAFFIFLWEQKGIFLQEFQNPFRVAIIAHGVGVQGEIGKIICIVGDQIKARQHGNVGIGTANLADEGIDPQKKNRRAFLSARSSATEG